VLSEYEFAGILKQNIRPAQIERAESPLRDAHNYAIQKTTNSEDYEEALWAIAESTHLERQIKDIYERSYLPIMWYRKSKGRKPLDIDKFRTRQIPAVRPGPRRHHRSEAELLVRVPGERAARLCPACGGAQRRGPWR
jgi:hypothetical protein